MIDDSTEKFSEQISDYFGDPLDQVTMTFHEPEMKVTAFIYNAELLKAIPYQIEIEGKEIPVDKLGYIEGFGYNTHFAADDLMEKIIVIAERNNFYREAA